MNIENSAQEYTSFAFSAMRFSTHELLSSLFVMGGHDAAEQPSQSRSMADSVQSLRHAASI